MGMEKTRRSELTERLTDHVLAHGLGSASLRPLAAAVGTSDRMLLYYFPDKASLVRAVLEAAATRMTKLLDVHRLPDALPPADLHNHLMRFALDNAVWPFMQLWLEIASLSARGDPTCRLVGEGIARGFLQWIGEQVVAENSTARRMAATAVLIRIEGAVLLKSLGLEQEVAEAAGQQ
jgi:AcrR family transcriptional regulator